MNTIIQTPTPNLSQSLDFYQRLNFNSLLSDQPVLISDGQLLLEVNPDRYARAGLKIYRTSWRHALEELDALTSVMRIDGGFLLSDPSGVWIYLIEGDSPVVFEPSAESTSTLGKYAGLSFETTDIGRSLRIWRAVGFSQSNGAPEQGWMTCKNADGVTISLMKPMSCPHLFFNPSLTFFNGSDNPAVIEKIRQSEIDIAEEITHFNENGLVDNVILRDPGGLGFFIFND